MTRLNSKKTIAISNYMKTDEVEQLKHQVAALEELLAVYEQSTVEKSRKLE
ncbi:MAG: hypothetical protein F6K24_52315, partial [Okeania sp. SIO2D1]|nr:hypothetical protein [Okeania sp. SIO2D1]